jgi:predicted DCC family thiol-disulfide oxidoreductase YuxK
MANDHTGPAEMEVFYDGGCPLCVREVAFLRRRDRRGRIRFTDIDAGDFQAESFGRTRDEFMAQIHARLPDGTWLRGVEVFRRLYAVVGFGPLVWLSRLPVVAPLLDRAYVAFARNRRWLTGRCDTGSCSWKPLLSIAPVLLSLAAQDGAWTTAPISCPRATCVTAASRTRPRFRRLSTWPPAGGTSSFFRP